jgi:hypothetical protein
MDSLEHWRSSTDLSVVQAALLMVGIDPSSEVGANCDSWKTHEQPPAYVSAKSALTKAILNGRLDAAIRRSAWHRGWDEEPGVGEHLAKIVEIYPDYSAELESSGPFGDPPWRTAKLRKVIYRAEPDWNMTTVEVTALRKWLSTQDVRSGFFFLEARQAVDVPDYLDKNHPRHSPWIAAVIMAWWHAKVSPGKSVKAGIKQWLRNHAGDYALSEAGIEACSKVANYARSGGAPKTPTE